MDGSSISIFVLVVISILYALWNCGWSYENFRCAALRKTAEKTSNTWQLAQNLRNNIPIDQLREYIALLPYHIGSGWYTILTFGEIETDVVTDIRPVSLIIEDYERSLIAFKDVNITLVRWQSIWSQQETKPCFFGPTSEYVPQSSDVGPFATLTAYVNTVVGEYSMSVFFWFVVHCNQNGLRWELCTMARNRMGFIFSDQALNDTRTINLRNRLLEAWLFACTKQTVSKTILDQRGGGLSTGKEADEVPVPPASDKETSHKYCPDCGTEAALTAKFCEKCRYPFTPVS